MEWLASFATTNVFTMVVILVAIGACVLAINKGWIKFKGDKLQIGLSEQQTRDLIQRQFEYTNAKCEAVVNILPEHLDKYRTKWIIARVEDVIQKAIIFNNLTDEESYIRSKQELCYYAVMKRVDDPYFKTEDFKAFLFKFVSDLFRELYRMKRINFHGGK